MRIKRVTPLIALAVLNTVSATATHLHGQEAGYEYLGNGRYKLVIRTYQDYQSGDLNAIKEDDPAFVSLFRNGIGYDSLVLLPTSRNVAVSSGPDGCVSGGAAADVRYTEYTQTVTLPGGAGGYRMRMERCCLGKDLANVPQSGERGLGWRADIPDPGSTPNSSPRFAPLRGYRACVNVPFTMDFSARDADGDSLVYRIGQPEGGGDNNDAKPLTRTSEGQPLLLAPGYSANAPFGAGGAFIVDPGTGIAQVMSSNLGKFLVTVACDEYRAGKFISSVQRTIVVQITNCAFSVQATARPDSNVLHSGITGLLKAQCNGRRTVRFENNSKGASGYRWNFGDTSTDSDTSSLESPEYTYPAPGKYTVTLVARGSGCSDSQRYQVWIASDTVIQDFTLSGGPCTANDFYAEDRSVLAPGAGATYRWITGTDAYTGKSTAIRFAGPGANVLQAIVITDSGCVVSQRRSIPVGQIPVHIGGDTTVNVGTRVRLTATGAEMYRWEPSPLATSGLEGANLELQTPAKRGTFRFVVTGSTASGCSSSDTVWMRVVDRSYAFVPEAFTPNGDGLNDILQPKTVDYRFGDFSVYNRRGLRVFYSESPFDGWDGRYQGTPQGLDTYHWMLRLRTAAGEPVTKAGDVLLVR